MLLLVFGRGFGVEADDRQQVFGVGEHFLLDHHAQLLVGQPTRVLAVVLRAGAQYEVDDLVAEVLRVADAGRFLDLLQLLVERGAVEDLAGFRVAVLLILNPEVGVQHVAVEDVLTVLAVGFQVGGLDFLADEFDVARRQVFLEEAQVAFADVVGELLLLNLLFQHVEQVHRVGGDLGGIEVEHLGEDLEGKAGRQAVHALVDARRVAVFLNRLGLGIGILQVFAVVDAHLRVDVRVFRLLQAREHGELGQHLQGVRCAVGIGQRAVGQQLFVDLDLVADTQAVGHLDDVDAVDERLVVLVVAEAVPFGFVGVGQNHAVERNCPHAFGTVVVALLGRGQQRMEDLDRRFEHLDELKQALVGPAQTAGVAVGIRVVLRKLFQLADIDLADQRGDVLIVFVAGFGLGDGYLLQHRGVELDHAKLGNIAVVFVQAFYRPGRDDAVEVAPRDAEVFLQNGAVFAGIEQPER